MCLFALCVFCLTALVNGLLNAFVMCVGEVIVFSLKVIVTFLGCVGFYWPIHVWSSKDYVCRVCNPSVCLGASPNVRFLCLYEGCDFRV